MKNPTSLDRLCAMNITGHEAITEALITKPGGCSGDSTLNRLKLTDIIYDKLTPIIQHGITHILAERKIQKTTDHLAKTYPGLKDELIARIRAAPRDDTYVPTTDEQIEWLKKQPNWSNLGATWIMMAMIQETELIEPQYDFYLPVLATLYQSLHGDPMMNVATLLNEIEISPPTSDHNGPLQFSLRQWFQLVVKDVQRWSQFKRCHQSLNARIKREFKGSMFHFKQVALMATEGILSDATHLLVDDQWQPLGEANRESLNIRRFHEDAINQIEHHLSILMS
jgi:hypothetical protein